MWIRPVNYETSGDNEMLKKMYKEYNIYKEFDKEAVYSRDALYHTIIFILKTFPLQTCLIFVLLIYTRKGNAMQTLGQ